MDKKKDYYLTPGSSVGKKGLPGGKLEAKNDYLKVDKKYFPVIGEVFDFLIAKGRMIDGEAYAKIKAEPEAPKEPGKSEKRLALEAEAMDLEVDFDDKTSQKELVAAIDAKKEELNS